MAPARTTSGLSGWLPCPHGRRAPARSNSHGHRSAKLRSIELHRAVAEHLRRDPELLARARVASWIAEGGPVPPYTAERWRTLLDRPLPVIVAAFVEGSEEMRDLRQCSPFAGALSQEERVAIFRRGGRST